MIYKFNIGDITWHEYSNKNHRNYLRYISHINNGYLVIAWDGEHAIYKVESYTSLRDYEFNETLYTDIFRDIQ